ncbi:putative outer membrane protein [Halobacteriovorax marinus SJ]|uniref:Outer membrane protein n=1 Tax=Halobacteriovorax marinus (strain ATCC BAA-682 / DSM 15412 / SJ) TaxID=862908 RepID=E1WXS6_HALMS|nr:TolC family protein [Halobacteriovorax marinus]CBW25883.1 putative outer membrane protein [Halobacteriovorax marinus SJ]
MFIFKVAIIFALNVQLVWSADGCKIENTDTLFSKLKENHPQIQYNQSLEKAKSEDLNIAAKYLNPEVDIQYAKGKSIEGDSRTTSLSLSFPLEVGGKRSAKKEVASASTEMTREFLRNNSEQAFIEVVLKSYRLRQINELLPIYKEAKDSLNKILRVKNKRKTLSPEEEVEKETLSLATNDYRLKISKLTSDREKFIKEISLALGDSCTFVISSLPGELDFSKVDLPKGNLEQAAVIKQASQEVLLAKAQGDLESAKTFSNISIGPKVEIEKIAGRSFKTYGLSLSMDLPIFNLNSSSKSKRLKEYRAALLNQQHIKRHTSIELESQLEKLNSLRLTLESIATKEQLERKHLKIEKLFSRGIISTAMIIESHRQLIEFANTRNEFELSAVESIWKIRKIHGKVF